MEPYVTIYVALKPSRAATQKLECSRISFISLRRPHTNLHGLEQLPDFSACIFHYYILHSRLLHLPMSSEPSSAASVGAQAPKLTPLRLSHNCSRSKEGLPSVCLLYRSFSHLLTSFKSLVVRVVSKSVSHLSLKLALTYPSSISWPCLRQMRWASHQYRYSRMKAIDC